MIMETPPPRLLLGKGEPVFDKIEISVEKEPGSDSLSETRPHRLVFGVSGPTDGGLSPGPGRVSPIVLT